MLIILCVLVASLATSSVSVLSVSLRGVIGNYVYSVTRLVRGAFQTACQSFLFFSPFLRPVCLLLVHPTRAAPLG